MKAVSQCNPKRVYQYIKAMEFGGFGGEFNFQGLAQASFSLRRFFR